MHGDMTLLLNTCQLFIWDTFTVKIINCIHIENVFYISDT